MASFYAGARLGLDITILSRELFQQLGHSYELIALLFQIFYNLRQGLSRLLAGIAGVHQNYVTGMRPFADPFNNGGNARVHPIQRIGSPLDGLIIAFVNRFNNLIIKIPIGGSDQFGIYP